jgi:DNA-directed RNA polymerase beta subunit
MAAETKTPSVGDYTIDQDALYMVGDAENGSRGMIHHHLSSMNNFYENGIRYIITGVFKAEINLNAPRAAFPDGADISRVHAVVVFTKVTMTKPTAVNYFSGRPEVVFPIDALRDEKTYNARLLINADITATAYYKDNRPPLVRKDTIADLTICEIPVMVRSVLCNTYGMSDEALTQLGEDPTDLGGYFILKGVEWNIECIENILFNQIRIHKNEGHEKEVMRAEFISKPGDTYQNMAYVLVRWLNDGQITLEIVRDKLRGVTIPIYLVYRLLGWDQDRQIFDHVVRDYELLVAKDMVTFLKQALAVKYTVMNEPHVRGVTGAAKVIIDHLAEDSLRYLELDKDDSNYRQATDMLFNAVDKHLLPHIGTTPGARNRKLQFISVIIRRIFLVKLGVLAQTDRDSFCSKRIHAAGESIAKPFKTAFNAAFIQQNTRQMRRAFTNSDFESVNLANLVRSSVRAADLGRLIERALTAGTDAQMNIHNRKVTNRIVSQLLVRKNRLNVLAALRQVSTTTSDSVKQSAGATRMRQVHMTSHGYLCCVHSPEGKTVGINKQMSIFATISKSTSSEFLKDYVRSDPDIKSDECPPEQMAREKLHDVYVNGDRVGCCSHPRKMAVKYRYLRRTLKIDPTTTVFWESSINELELWTDMGRFLRPLMIVYNNRDNPEKFPSKMREASAPFLQGLAITKKEIDLLYAKKLSIDDLIKMGVVEYISPEEQTNCFVCPEFNQLRIDRNNELRDYTHCDIPQGIVGITALTCPLGHHNQVGRVIYQTNQAKHTCGAPPPNWPFRFDKDAFGQHDVETPLVTTVAQRYTPPNGCNVILALACYSGYNNEDALIIGEGSTIGRGLFNGNKWTFVKTVLEQKEAFGNPDVTTTTDIKSANHEKLEDGIPIVGSRIVDGDAIIGKYIQLSGEDEQYQFSDRSVVHRDEDAVVQSVVVSRDQNDNSFCKVSLRKHRPVVVGDKFSMRGTAQVLTEHGWIAFQDLDPDNLPKVASLNGDRLVYVKPQALSSYEYDGDMCYMDTPDLHFMVTMNHKLYVREEGKAEFELCRAYEVRKALEFKKDATYHMPTRRYCAARDGEYAEYYPADLWIKLLGMVLSYGTIDQSIMLHRADAPKLLDTMRINHSGGMIDKKHVCLLRVFAEMNGRFPAYVWDFGQRQARLLFDSMRMDGHTPAMADDLTRLALHAGLSATVINDVVHVGPPTAMGGEMQYVPYKGRVYCLEVHGDRREGFTDVYYSRESPSKPGSWTGNSSRSAQKGVCALLLRDSAMPRTATGMAPEIIMNPHAIPSRMTVAQPIEGHVGNICAAKGTHVDGTFFRQIDVEAVADELEEMGMDRYGRHKLYSGITGEWIEAEIFMGPVFFQRLQKFVADQVYSIAHGPSDAITYQPLDGGKSNHGGLRMGEMVVWCLTAHGVSRFIQEKFRDHSDGYMWHICRECNMPCVVNHRERIYKCNTCGDDADPVSIPTTWTAKLLNQEVNSMHIRAALHPAPYTYYEEEPESKE